MTLTDCTFGILYFLSLSMIRSASAAAVKWTDQLSNPCGKTRWVFISTYNNYKCGLWPRCALSPAINGGVQCLHVCCIKIITVSVIRKFPFCLSFTIVEQSLNDHWTIARRYTYDPPTIVPYTYVRSDEFSAYTLLPARSKRCCFVSRDGLLAERTVQRG